MIQEARPREDRRSQRKEDKPTHVALMFNAEQVQHTGSTMKCVTQQIPSSLLVILDHDRSIV